MKIEAGRAGLERVRGKRQSCLSPEDCLGYLEKRTGSPLDEAVYLHIDDCPSCRRVMAEALRATMSSAAATVRRGVHTLRDGERVGDRYDVRRFIARGGMGEVYEAYDSVLGDTVALKTLVPTALDQVEAAERLLGEVRLARQVNHANVCRIFEVGIHRGRDAPGEAIPFLTMPFLEGETLAARLAREGRLPHQSALAIVRDLTAGLAAIHAEGVVHRDFKSENVFLCNGRAIVMDFGLARGERRPGQRASSGQVMLGTIEYMAPEQLEGAPITPAVDIYALGIVMFEMLTGKLPFAGSTPAGAALARLSQKAPLVTTVAPGLQRAWDAVVARCLEREPQRRFRSPSDVMAALVLRREAPLRRWRARRLVAALSATVAAFAFVLAVAWPRGKQAPAASAAGRRGLGPGAAAARATPQAEPPAQAVPSTVAAPAPAVTGATSPHVPAQAPGFRTVAHKRRVVAVGARHAAPTTVARLDEAEAALLEGDVPRACALGEEVRRAGGAPAAIHRFLGRCYTRAGDLFSARASYRRYLEIAPEAPDAPFVRAIVERQERR
jgi:tRNA A-37 threonylcarbamoyl transferase component Bud32